MEKRILFWGEYNCFTMLLVCAVQHLNQLQVCVYMYKAPSS